MRRKFLYNPETCQYEPVFLTWKSLWKKTFNLLSVSFVAALGAFTWYTINYSPIQEQLFEQKNKELKLQWKALDERIARANATLNSLVDQDDHNYRVILDLPALSAQEREAGVGGAAPDYPQEANAFPLIVESFKKVEKLNHQLDIESQSFEQLHEIADRNLTMWASRPAIQPISNKQLDRLHTTYGARFHPIFLRVKDHKGLDFSAPRGTPVYATGDGRVSMAYSSGSYGNVVYVDHGFDFETRYAHLNRFIVQAGEYVKRGQVIGYVGNTGISASPHLHYEVLVKGNHTNPINFFQRDLSNMEYERLLTLSAGEKASLD